MLFQGETVPLTSDGLFHIHRIQAVTTLMQSGDLYPRWIPWFHLGYGYPVLNYYSPLATWLAGVLGALGFSIPAAFQTVCAAFWMLGSLGTYTLARRCFPWQMALLAAALWVYAPSRMHEYWIQGSISHVAATALAPWVFWALITLIQQPGSRQIACFGLACGALLLAHQPTALLMLFYLAPLTLGLLGLRLYREKHFPFQRILSVSGGVILAIGLASIFLLPMLLELDYIVINQTSAGNIPAILRQNFLSLSDLFHAPPLLDHTDLSATIPHTFGLIPGVLAMIGIIGLYFHPTKRTIGILLALMIALGVSIFMMLPLSEQIWLHVPLMDQLRFPWRVMRIAIIPLSLLGGASLYLLPSRWRDIGLIAGVAIGIAAALPSIYPTANQVDYAALTPADSLLYEAETGAVGGTSYNEFKPIWGALMPPVLSVTDVEAYAAHPQQLYVSEAQHLDTHIQTLGTSRFRVTAKESTWVKFRQFYFPGWKASLDGHDIPLTPDPEYGLISLTIPPGEHLVDLHYAGTNIQHIASLISVLSVIITLTLLIRGHSTSRISGMQPSPSVLWGLCAGILLFALVNTLIIAPRTHWFRRMSPPQSPAAMQTPVHASFGDAYELLGYTLNQTSVDAGKTLKLTLFWHPLRTLEREHHPLVQLTSLNNNDTWASSEPFFIGVNPVQHTPDRFISETYQLEVAEDALPYVGQIRIGLIDNATGEPLLLEDNQPSIILPEVVHIHQQNPEVPIEVNSVGGISIENSITMQQIELQHVNGRLLIDIYWKVDKPLLLEDVTTFVHGLDSNGNVIMQGDAPPLGGEYPLIYWQKGQILHDHYVLLDAQDITHIALGMYTPAGRLSITRNNQPVADNRLILSASGGR